MAQTTYGLPRSNFQVQVSTNGSSWTDISGVATTVQRSDGDQMVGEQNTADGASPVVTGSNKKAAETVTVRALYTEQTGEGWKTVHDRYRGTDKTIYVRWAPKGGIGTVAGNVLFTCADEAGTALKVPIINCTLPDLDAGSGDPAMFEFSVRTPSVLASVTSTS
jgi:hypothetical protein